MPRFIRSRQKTKGLPPGTLITNTIHDKEEIVIQVVNYNKNVLEEKTVSSVKDCTTDTDNKDTVTWVNVKGLTDNKLIEEIGKTFGIHKLWLEDVLNTDHRPKLEELDDLIFCIVKSVDYNGRKKDHVSSEQISLFLGQNFVLSFQEHSTEAFGAVHKRIVNSKGRIRESEADYLFYCLLDSLVDDYFLALEGIGSEIESLEKRIFNEQGVEVLSDIMRLKNELIFIKKSAAPIRDSIYQIYTTEKEEVRPGTKKYLKDAYDHSLQVVEIINSYFDMVNGAKETFDSAAAAKLNDVMRVLTIFASIFIPLTFIAGIYGMNFENMPELKWKYGYQYSLALMGIVGLGLVIYFRKKKWL